MRDGLLGPCAMVESASTIPASIVFLATDIGRLFRKRFDTAAREFGVTGPQWRVLVTLRQKPGQTQTMLAGKMDVEAITTGRMIDRLQKLGLVERRPDPADRRAWLLYVTPAADTLLDRLQRTAELVIEDVLSGFGAAEGEALLCLLTRLRDNLGKDEQDA